MIAAENRRGENHAGAVQLLIDLGADVNVKNKFGASALEEAVQVEANEAVEVLRWAAEKRGLTPRSQ